MAQIHALTPEGRLPSAAVGHAEELIEEANLRSALQAFDPHAIWRGSWDPDSTYAAGDAVTMNGDVWIANTEVSEQVRINYALNPRFATGRDWTFASSVTWTPVARGLQITTTSPIPATGTILTKFGGVPTSPGTLWSRAFRIEVAPETGALPFYIGGEGQYSPPATVASGRWGRVDWHGFTATDDNLGTQLRAGPGGIPAGAVFTVTDALFEIGPVAGSFFNGAYNNTSTTTHYWEGEADMSRSFAVTVPQAPGPESEAWTRVTDAMRTTSLPAPTRTHQEEKFTPTVGPVQAVFYPTNMDRNDRTSMISHNSSVLRLSRDEGETWQVVTEFTGFPVRSGIFLDNGEVLVSVRATDSGSHHKVMLSEGFPQNPETATWTEVLEGTVPDATPSGGFSWSHHGSVVIMGEYGPKIGVGGSGVAARHVYASRDYGKTWTLIFDLLTDHPEITMTEGLHIHGTCYDPYWDRIWISHGDDQSGILFSDDFGATWEVADFTPDRDGPNQVVGIIALPKCVLFATDGHPNGVLRINRAEGKHKGRYSVEVGYLHDTVTGLTILCQNIFRANRLGDDAPAVFEFVSAPGDGKRFVLTTVDGYTFNKVWEDPEVTRGNTSGRAVGPTLSGRLLIYAADGRFTSGRTHWAGPMPNAY